MPNSAGGFSLNRHRSNGYGDYPGAVSLILFSRKFSAWFSDNPEKNVPVEAGTSSTGRGEPCGMPGHRGDHVPPPRILLTIAIVKNDLLLPNQFP